MWKTRACVVVSPDEMNAHLPTVTVAPIADFIANGWQAVITHGNGPQVGDLMLKQECCDAVPKLPLEILVAQTQGQIGYMIESTLDTELMHLGDDSEHYFVSLLSYVVVDKNDPRFQEVAARELVDLYSYLYIGYLALDEAEINSRKIFIANRYITNALANARKNAESIKNEQFSDLLHADEILQ